MVLIDGEALYQKIWTKTTNRAKDTHIDAFTIPFCAKSWINFRTFFFGRRVNASGRVDKKRRIIEAVRPFEPRSGSTLVEQPQ